MAGGAAVLVEHGRERGHGGGQTCSLRLPPTLMPLTPMSQPLITSPPSIVKTNPLGNERRVWSPASHRDRQCAWAVG